jgi:CheY-like chemotaxis protein
MDGFTLADNMRRDPRLARAVILMLTSAGQRGDARRCKQLGISAYLVKPISNRDLMHAVLRVLGQSGDQSQLVTRHTLRERRGALRILVAEDNAVNQTLILRLLEKHGHSPELAQNGREAVEKVRNGRFDLVFMDVQMPEMDGFSATTAIRDLEKTTGTHVLIYAMTAHAMKGDRERCLAAGMDGYVSKPINFPEVERVLQSIRPQTAAAAGATVAQN